MCVYYIVYTTDGSKFDLLMKKRSIQSISYWFDIPIPNQIYKHILLLAEPYIYIHQVLCVPWDFMFIWNAPIGIYIVPISVWVGTYVNTKCVNLLEIVTYDI